MAGIFQQLSDAFLLKPLLYILFPYAWLYDKYHIIDLDSSSLSTWVIAFLAVDFCYYWFHRAAHEVNIFWGAHVVHHSSEHYNLSTSLRQSAAQSWISFLFYFPLVLFLPVEIFTFHKQWNTLYQFWVHSTSVRRMGALEWVIATPSHHRCHHDRRLHCNYAGTLIIWDRLFGTFKDEGEGFRNGKYDPLGHVTKSRELAASIHNEHLNENDNPEEENVIYGVSQKLHSYNPFYVQFHHYMHILDRVAKAKSLAEALRTIFKGPGYRPKRLYVTEILKVEEDQVHRIRREVHVNKSPLYLFFLYASFVLALMQVLVILAFHSALKVEHDNPFLAALPLYASILVVGLTFVGQAKMFDGDSNSRSFEQGLVFVVVVIFFV